jgi:phosphatidylinositol alpha-1,6-mannosyltransferase
MPEILGEHPDAHLVFVGVGPYEDYLRELAHSLDVTDHITFVGRVQYSELPQYISLGEVFAMPTRSRFFGLEVEGLGIVYLEASACGLPIVGGMSGGAPDALIEGETGFAVDGKQHLHVAERINYLLADPELAAKMGARGRQWIVDEWEWKKWSREFNELLDLS